ncbi:MAG: hypothetical protein IPO27_13385 [Bacteroidetes bacterium]|nr:hypothetical protein [Bacteroidota bacterium]
MVAWRNIMVLLLVVQLCSSCLKEENAVQLPQPGNGTIAQVEQGELYEQQVYFNLSNKDTFNSRFAAWDLAFDAQDNNFFSYMNGGKLMHIAKVNSNIFSAVTDTTGLVFLWDAPSWNKDSLAIGNWNNNKNQIFVVDRGYLYSNFAERFWKIRIVDCNNNSFRFEYASIASTQSANIVIERDNNFSYQYFTFDNAGNVLSLEPQYNQWHIQFTRYRVIFSQNSLPFPYLVTGVLINPNMLQATVDSSYSYEKVDYEFAKNKILTKARDAIGFEWKYFDINAGMFKS